MVAIFGVMRAIAVDDEPKLTALLESKLQTLCPDVIVIDRPTSVQEAVAAIQKEDPDILFLDINLTHGTGFDVLDYFPNPSFKVIFITAYDQYAIQAFKCSAVDYLLKPIQDIELVNAVQKVKSLSTLEDQQHIIDALKANVGSKAAVKKIALPREGGYEIVALDNIIHCEGWEKYTKIHLEDEVFVSSYNLGYYKDVLMPLGFLDIHKSHIINPHHLVRYLNEGTVILTGNRKAPVSRRKKESVLAAIL